MNSLPKLAVLIFDDKFDVDRKIFINALKTHTQNFDAYFFYIGPLKNYFHYEDYFQCLNFKSNYKNQVIQFNQNNFNNYDYYLYITPEIILKSEINEINFDFDKINVLKNQNFLIFLSSRMHLVLNYYLESTNEEHNFNLNNLIFDKNYSTIKYNFKFSKNNNTLLFCNDRKFPENIKKVGIVFTGISHDDGKIESGWAMKYIRSFKDCFENHYEKLINPYKEFSDVDIHLTTYNSNSIEQLKNVYLPSSIIILNDFNLTMRKTYLMSIGNLIENAKNLDFFICTRFDIKFYNKITSWNLNYEKFNILFVENWSNDDIEICDVLFAFPRKFLVGFYSAVKQADKNPRRLNCLGDLHDLFPHISKSIGEQNIHFVTKRLQSTAGAVGFEQKANSFFYLCRYASKK